MGISISCKKTGRTIDMGAGGFWNLRKKVSDLVGGEWAEHYRHLDEIERDYYFDSDARHKAYVEFDAETLRLVAEKKVSAKIVDFLLQSDCDGSIRYGACKQILKVVEDYDDNICYGYAGRKDCAMFRDFKAILRDCVDTKTDMIWD